MKQPIRFENNHLCVIRAQIEADMIIWVFPYKIRNKQRKPENDLFP